MQAEGGAAVAPLSSAMIVARVSPPRKLFMMMAGSTGLEPATSGVTGRRSNQLNYDPARSFLVGGTGIEPVTAGV